MTSDCRHRSLHFGSGGYYVLCSDCSATWIAWKIGEDERVPGVIKGQPVVGCRTMGERHEPQEKGQTK